MWEIYILGSFEHIHIFANSPTLTFFIMKTKLCNENAHNFLDDKKSVLLVSKQL